MGGSSRMAPSVWMMSLRFFFLKLKAFPLLFPALARNGVSDIMCRAVLAAYYRQRAKPIRKFAEILIERKGPQDFQNPAGLRKRRGGPLFVQGNRL
jgi:hypothetical protein